jgi:trans-aconitate 2-methyltransferase
VGPWDPDQYARFRAERAQPFFDLLALVRPAPAMRVVDLGCGTGDLTKVAHERLGAASTIGVDSSESMLERSKMYAASGLRFQVADLAELEGTFDLILSNSAIHWVDDHPALLARLTRRLAPGGQLAIQLPANFDHPSHAGAAEIARESPFREALAGYQHLLSGLPPERYAELLHELGFAEQHVRLNVYGHILASRDEVLEWLSGTLLTDYKRRLSGELYAQFLARYREVILPRLRDTRPYFFPFKRILFWGRLPPAA